MEEKVNIYEKLYVKTICEKLNIKNKRKKILVLLDKYRKNANKRYYQSNKDVSPINVYEISGLIYLITIGLSKRVVANATNTTEMSVLKYKRILSKALKIKKVY